MAGPIDAYAAYAAYVAEVEADPCVLGLLLHGSRAFEGMTTKCSDYDLVVVTDRPDQHRRPDKATGLDVAVNTLETFRKWALHGTDLDRYIFTHAHILIDNTNGQIPAIIREAETFPTSSEQRLPGMLDHYINGLYRSLKNHRNGHLVESHLDAAASVGTVLWVIFAFYHRVVPCNKYLRWELRRRPLPPPWDSELLVARLRRILTNADPVTQRALFHDIEDGARSRGLDEVVDDWGADLTFLRGAA